MFDAGKARFRRRRMKTLKPFGKPAAKSLRLSLGDLNAEVAQALADAFAGADAVEVVEGNLITRPA